MDSRNQTNGVVGPRPEEQGGCARVKPPYSPPRIAKRRAVSRATLFTGSGPDAGGLVGSGN